MFILYVLLFFLAIPFVIIAVLPYSRLNLMKNVAFFSSIFIFIFSLFDWLYMDQISANFQYILHLEWNNFFNFYYSGGLDGISLLFIVLTALLIPLCILYSWKQFPYFFKELVLLLFLVEGFLFHFFFVSDVFFFFIF